MTERVDMQGLRVGRLIVAQYAGCDVTGIALWTCFCDCGRNAVVRGTSLRKGHTLSCGCLKAEAAKKAIAYRWA